MDSAIEEVNSVQRRITVNLTQEQVDAAFGKMFQDLKKKVKLKGFRPGKVPLNMLRRFYGESSRPEVFERLIKENLFTAIESNKLRPAASPVIETSEMPTEGSSYSFSALVDIMPTITLDDKYKELSARVELPKFDESSVQNELDTLRRHKAKTKPAPEGTKAAAGHLVVISHEGEIDGEKNDSLSVKDFEVELGKEGLIADVEKAIIGLKAGEDKKVKFKLPKDYGAEDLAGKKVSLHVTLSEIKELDLPALDDEFAKDIGLEGVEQLRKNVEVRLKGQRDQMRRQQIEHQLLDALIKKYTFDVPPSFVDQIIDTMIKEMTAQSPKAEQEKMLHDNEMRTQFRESAKKRAQNTLLLHEIAMKENMTVTDDDLKEYFAGFYRDMGQEPAPEQLQSMVQSMGGQAKESLLLDKAMKMLIEAANIAETTK